MVKKVGEEFEEKVRKRKGGQGNRGRKPGSTGAPKSPPKKSPSNGGSNGGSKSTKSTEESNGAPAWLGAAKDLSDSLAEASPNKVWRQAGIKALVGKKVSANEGDLNKGGLDTTLTGIGYNSDNTGPDMGQMDPKKRKEEYGF